MDGLNLFWVVFILISPFLPQIVGFISYLLLKKQNDLVAHILGVIIPPVSSFYLFKRLFSIEFFSVDFDSLGRRATLLFFGSFLQLFFSLMIQLAIHNRHKLKEEKVS